MEMLATATYTNEMSLADRMNKVLAEIKMTKQEAALQIGYSRTALSQYLSGKYTSDATVLEEKIMNFLNTVERKPGEDEDGPVTIRKKIDYFECRDYMAIIGLCRECQEHRALGIVVGRSGQGKTHTLKKYATLPRVIYIEGNETMNCKDIVRRIEDRIGMQRRYGSIDERMERLINFFNVNEGYLIIMDEADKLINKYTQKKIELLRNITDGADVGLVLAGEPVLESLMKAYDQRFTNRMDFYYHLKGLTEEEVADYLKGYNIDKNAMAEFIARARNKQTGCFRLLDRTLNNVIRILKDSGKTEVDMKVMSQASNMMML